MHTKIRKLNLVALIVFTFLFQGNLIPSASALLTFTTTTKGTYYGGNYYADPNPTVMCSTGYALTAVWSNATLVGSNEDYSQAFAITCTKLNDDRTLSAVTELKTVLSTKTPDVSSSCTSGKAATEVRVRWILTTTTHNTWTMSTGVNCNNTTDYLQPEVNAMAQNTTSSAGTVTLSTSSCQSGSFVIGIEYESGAGLHGIGALCGSLPDLTAPTFSNSNSVTIPENTSVLTNVVSIQISESSTIAMPSGADISRFTLVISDSISAYIRFVTSPDFEAPLDSGGDNIFNITVRATDTAGNATSQSLIIQVTDVSENSVVGSLSIPQSVSKGAAVTISISVNNSGSARFYFDGKRIPSCLKRPTSGVYPNLTITCTWKPAVSNYHSISAVFTPTSSTFNSVASSVAKVFILKRNSNR